MKCYIPNCDIPIHCFSFLPSLEDARMYLWIEGEKALAVDPCPSKEAAALLEEAGVREITILLTHEHYDHIAGVNGLRQGYACNVICTETCAGLIEDPRKNLSQYCKAQYITLETPEQVAEKASLMPFSCRADTTFRGIKALQFGGCQLVLTETPGHSKGSACITMDDAVVFTGDNLIPGRPVVTRLPGGSRADYLAYALPYLRSLPSTMWALPGHFAGAALRDLLKEVKDDATAG